MEMDKNQFEVRILGTDTRPRMLSIYDPMPAMAQSHPIYFGTIFYKDEIIGFNPELIASIQFREMFNPENNDIIGFRTVAKSRLRPEVEPMDKFGMVNNKVYDNLVTELSRLAARNLGKDRIFKGKNLILKCHLFEYNNAHRSGIGVALDKVQIEIDNEYN